MYPDRGCLPLQDSSGPDFVNFSSDVGAVQDFRLHDQDLSFLHSGRPLHDFDSRLNVINVSQDSRLSVNDMFFPDLQSSVHEQFIPDFRSDNSTRSSDPLVREFVTPPNSHDSPIEVLSPTTDVSFSSPQEHSHVNFKDINVVSLRSSLVDSVADVFAPYSFVELHNRVYPLGVPNFLGARVAVPTSLNVSLWRSLLSEYSDPEVCEFLEFGWPINFDYSRRGVLLSREFRNHTGALDFPAAVDSYLSTELMFGSVCGPFARNPFSVGHMAVSPLNSVPKPDSDERRFILDLSWPAGSSVNDGISKDFYLGQPVTLRYPTVDDIAERIVQFGSGCLLYKRDLKRAYRQLPVDPYDYPLLGYSWRDQLYFDVHLPMGLRSAAMACQRVTNAVCFMLSQYGCDVLSYLDDFMGVSAPPTAFQHYALCGSLLAALGLQESSHKACPPSTQMTCLGVLFDTVALTMSVTPERLNQLQDELLPMWLAKKSATKTELQSLIGKLSFVSKCVRPGRLFLTRILDTLRSLRRNHHRIKLTAEFRKDIHW